MSKPEPPRPGNRLSVTEIVLPSAVHEARPVPPPDARPTLPPPNDPRAAPRTSMLGVRPPIVVPEPEPDDGDRPSTVEALTAADRLAAELAQRNPELAEAKRQIEAARRAPPAPSGPTEREIRKAQMHAAVLKVLIALAGALGAVTLYLSVHSATVLPPRVESAEVRTKAVETANDSDHAALVGLREYLRAEQARRECLDSQIGSALARYTGHRISGSATSVEWIESNMPTRRPVLLWDRAIWYPATPCAAETRLP